MPADFPRERSAIFLFIVLALGLSIGYWIVIHFWPKGVLPYALEQTLWAIFRGFGPALAAVVAAYYARGCLGLHDLWSSLIRWRISWKLYLLAFLGPAIVVGLSIACSFFVSKAPVSFAPVNPIRLVMIFLVMIFIDGPLGEEVGWRGFLLPRLLERMNPVAASLIVGCVWYVWHFPLYAADGMEFSPVTLSTYFISTNALAIIFTWFFLRNGGSTFFAIILHNTSNYFIYLSRMLFPQLRTVTAGKMLYVILMALLGIAAAISMQRKRQQVVFSSAAVGG